MSDKGPLDDLQKLNKPPSPTWALVQAMKRGDAGTSESILKSQGVSPDKKEEGTEVPETTFSRNKPKVSRI